MALQFNPPPNWPKPPEGWSPTPGWRPEPSWGPAPQGWSFWVDDNGNPVPSEHPEDPSFVPTDPQQSEQEPQAEQDPGFQPTPQFQQDTQAQPTQQWQQPADGRPSQAGGWNQGPQAGHQYSDGAWNGGQWGQPPRKKNFFATAGGILSIIGTVLLILVIVLVLVLTGVIGGSKDSGETSASSQAAENSSSSSSGVSDGSSGKPSASATGSAPSGKRPEQANLPANDAKPVAEFSGSGDQKVSTDKLDDSTAYYVQYWYQGDSNFGLWGLDEDGEDAGLYANDIDETSGTSWLDLDGLYGNPKGFHVEGDDGKWEVKVYDAVANVSKGDKNLQSNGTVALAYEGPQKTATIKNKSHDSVEVKAFDLSGEPVLQESVDKGTEATLDLPDAAKDGSNVLVQVTTTYADSKWDLDFS